MVLGRWLHLGSTLQIASQQQADLVRLKRQFSADAREANSLETPEGEVVRFYAETGHSIAYLQMNAAIQRVERQGESVVQREGYRLASGTRLRVDPSGDERKLVRLRIEPVDEDGPSASLATGVLLAPLAADHRFERSSGGVANP
jgi:hypothetical protein